MTILEGSDLQTVPSRPILTAAATCQVPAFRYPFCPPPSLTPEPAVHFSACPLISFTLYANCDNPSSLVLGRKRGQDELRELMKAADVNGDGRIDYKEFASMMSTALPAA